VNVKIFITIVVQLNSTLRALLLVFVRVIMAYVIVVRANRKRDWLFIEYVRIRLNDDFSIQRGFFFFFLIA
jgi:hypothetical protein